MAVSWTRTVQANFGFATGSSKVASIPQGNTLLRVRFGWGFYGTTSNTASITAIAQNIMVFGLVTLASTDEATIPNPRTNPTDPDPPLSRWLWWEGRAPDISAYSDDGGLIAWRDSRLQEAADGKGMVAGNVGDGDTLDLWASWSPADVWDTSGSAYLWFWASVAYKTTT